MALIQANRVQETSTSTGTGAFTLLGAIASDYQTFLAAIGNGNTCRYEINLPGSQWETGIGTISTTGPTLTRTTPLTGSAGANTAVNFSAGTKNVTLSINAEGVLDASVAAPLASPTFTGTVTVPTTVNATDAAQKAYVDAVAQGLAVKGSCALATAAALPTNTYNNGASGVGATLTGIATGTLTVDGVLTTLGMRILVQNEVAGANNGLYLVTTAGAGGVAYVLTRTTDANTSADLVGAFTFIEQGTVNASAGFVCTNSSAITIGTTAITFTQFSGAGEITAGAGISKSGNTLSAHVDGSTIDTGAAGNALEIVAGGVGTTQLAANAVTTAKIAANAVTSAKIDSSVAPTASPALTGSPTTPDPTTGTGIANKEYVDASVIGAPVYNVKTGYSAKGDGIEGNSASITATQNTLTVTGSPFLVGDVGKAIQVVGAGAAGAVLNTTISAFTDANHVTLTAAAGTTVSNQYFAYGTDDTTAIQNALNAAVAGGTVYFPSGCYIIAGALQNLSATIAGNTYTQSVQLQIPAVDYFAGPMATIKMMGPNIPCPSPSVTGAAPLQTAGVILRGFAASGNLIGGLPPGTSTTQFNGICVAIENICFRLYDNPQATALNLSYIAAVQLNNVNADTGVAYTDGETYPTSSSAYGIMLPRDGNGAYTQVVNALVQGYYYGFEFNEHTNAFAISAWGCKYAAWVSTADHAMHIKRFEVVHCSWELIFGGNTQFISLPGSPIDIEQLDIETTTSGPFAWVGDISDGSSYGIGTINWRIVKAGGGYTHTFAVTGGGGIIRNEIGTHSNPAGPLGLMATSGNTFNELTWTAVSGSTGYNIFRGTDPGSMVQINNGALTVTTYVDVDLANGQEYFYAIQSTIGSFVSALSNLVSGVPSASAATVVTQNWDTDTTGFTLYGAMARTAESWAHSGGFVLADPTPGDVGLAISAATDGASGNQVVSTWLYFNDNSALIESWLLARTTNAAVASLVGYAIDIQASGASAGLSLRYRSTGANTDIGLGSGGGSSRPGHTYFGTSGNYYQKWFRLTLSVWGNVLTMRIYDPTQTAWLDHTSTWQQYPCDADTVIDASIASGTAQHAGVMGYGVNATAFGLDDFTLQNAQGVSVSAFVGTQNAQTLSYKRITRRVLTLSANSATPAILTDSYDLAVITGQSANITSFTSSLTGTPNEGDRLEVRITSTGTITIAWGTSFSNSNNGTLPTGITGAASVSVTLEYWAALTGWVCMGNS